MQAAAGDLSEELDALSLSLAERPVDAGALAERLAGACGRVQACCGDMAEARDRLLASQARCWVETQGSWGDLRALLLATPALGHTAAALPWSVRVQSEVVACESKVGEVEGALQAAAALLGGWSGTLAWRAAEGDALDEGTRAQLKEELQAAEQRLHR